MYLEKNHHMQGKLLKYRDHKRHKVSGSIFKVSSWYYIEIHKDIQSKVI